jgi:hypothetical protein
MKSGILLKKDIIDPERKRSSFFTQQRDVSTTGEILLEERGTTP